MVRSSSDGSPPAQHPRQEILPFTALRGLAAWWVAVYHFGTLLPAGGVLERFIGNGPLAVDLFFIMSGYVLALSYGDQFSIRVSARDYARFMVLRLGRIYPLHIVVVAAFLSVPITLAVTGRAPVENQFQPSTYLANIFLVQNWLPGSGLDWNVPAWSISTELMFYLLFPVLALIGGRMERSLTILIVILALLVGIAVGYGPGSYTADFGPGRCVPECMLGMLLFRIAIRIPLPGSGCSFLFALFVLLVCLNGTQLGADQVTMPAAFLCLLWSLLNRRFWVSRLLSNPFLLWLGHISFSTYLVHFLVKYWMKFLFVGILPDALVFAMYVVIVVLASWALHVTVELPGREGGRYLAKRLNTPTSGKTFVQAIPALGSSPTREPGL